MIAILAYHSISDSEYRFATSKGDFYDQLILLKKKGFRFIAIEELYNLIISKKKISEKLALVTFDDGFEDNFLNAFPILKELNVPAVIFIATALVGRTSVMSGHTFKFCNWKQLGDMKMSKLISIQSHGHNHIIMSDSTLAEIMNDLVIANKLMINELQHAPSYFTYPKGRINDEAIRVAMSVYKLCFAGNGVIVDASKISLGEVPRIMIYGDVTLNKLSLKLHPTYWKLFKIFTSI